jgi:hypothetical protein
MTDYRLKDLRGADRRNFLKWIGAAGAAIGLERSKLLNVLADSGGSALADTCATANRSLHIVGGNGSFAWFQLLWPHIEVAAPAGSSPTYFPNAPGPNPAFAYLSPGQGVLYNANGTPNGDQPFFYGPQAPWLDATGNPLPGRQVTGLMSGQLLVHTGIPTSVNMVGPNATILGACAAIQAQAYSTLVPMLVVGGVPDFASQAIGFAQGVPAPASVSDSTSMVGLFNSVASTTALALQANKNMYDTYFNAYLGLRYAANLPTSTAQVQNAKAAASLLGFNYGGVLTPTADDLNTYGVTTLVNSGVDPDLITGFGNLGRALIVAAKAFKNSLTNTVVIAMSPEGNTPPFTDPHTAFTSNVAQTPIGVAALGTMLNAFYNDLASVPDPTCSSQTLDKSVVFHAYGDNTHDPFTGGGNGVGGAWPDVPLLGGSQDNPNWMYVMGNGAIKTGWFGGMHLSGHASYFNPANGQSVLLTGGDNTAAVQASTFGAGAAVTYAVAQKQKNVVAPFYGGAGYAGIVNT